MTDWEFANATLVYTALPKYLAGMDHFIARYVFGEGAVPLTPYQYPMWLLDSVERDTIRAACGVYLDRSDECWVFAADNGVFMDTVETVLGLGIHDGVLREMEWAKEWDQPVLIHRIDIDTQEITRVGEWHGPGDFS